MLVGKTYDAGEDKMLQIGTYENNILFRITNDNSGELITQLLLSPETAILVSDRIIENVKHLNPTLINSIFVPTKTKVKATSKESKKTTKKK